MIVTYHGRGFVKIQQGDLVVAFNPVSKKSEAKQTRFGADLALVSVNHDDYNGIDQVTLGERVPFVIDGPGEYEVGGIFIKGLPSTGPNGKINTIYELTFDDIKIVHTGALADSILDSQTQESLVDVDVLLLPIGGDDVLDAKVAHKFALEINPHLVIPLEYDGPEGGKALASFLKEAGVSADKAQPKDKLTFRKKELLNQEAEIAVLAVV